MDAGHDKKKMTSAAPSCGCRVLLIDNYDSYSFNLFHLIAKVTGCEPILVQNDEFEGDWDSLLENLRQKQLRFDCIVVGPGPGTPENPKYLGLSDAVVRREDVEVPVLGVCLGMQAMVFACGGRVVRAPVPMHGRLSSVRCVTPSKLFQNIDFPFNVVRYHSLAVDMRGTEDDLIVTARAEDDDVVMALEHRRRPLFGVQFHPESICAGLQGEQIMSNFVRFAMHGHSASCSTTIPSHVKRIKSENSLEIIPALSKRLSLEVLEIVHPQTTTEEIYSLLFQSYEYRAWFDSAMEHPRRGKFSLLCKQNSSSKHLGDRIEFYVDTLHRRMDINATHGDLRNAGDCTFKVFKRKGENQNWMCSSARKGKGCEPFTHMNAVLERHRPFEVVLSKGFDTSQKETQRTSSFDELPFDFCCGYVGVMGYGLRKLCGVKQIPDESSVVEEAEENGGTGSTTTIPDLAYFFSDQAVVFDHSSGKVYVLTLCDMDDAEQSHQQETWRNQVVELLMQQNNQRNLQTTSSSVSLNRKETTTQEECDGLSSPIRLVPVRNEREYIQDVHACLEKIREGETYEVCLTTQLIAEKSEVDPSILYKNLRRHNPAPFCALYAFGDKFTMCSSSPERYLRVDSTRTVESRPIKGTVRRGENEQEDMEQRDSLSKSEKDRSENLMIVDLVRNDLGRVCQVKSICVPDLFVVESFRTVHQLVSTIQGKLKPGCTAVDAAKAAFPPGSMTGAPKERTMQIIDSIEPEERGFYSGALGFFSVSGAADLSVVIRTAIIQKSRVTVGAGGAIIAMSDPVQERQEMVLKVKALGPCFELVEK